MFKRLWVICEICKFDLNTNIEGRFRLWRNLWCHQHKNTFSQIIPICLFHFWCQGFIEYLEIMKNDEVSRSQETLSSKVSPEAEYAVKITKCIPYIWCFWLTLWFKYWQSYGNFDIWHTFWPTYLSDMHDKWYFNHYQDTVGSKLMIMSQMVRPVSRERKRERDRQTDRQRQRQTDKQRQRQTKQRYKKQTVRRTHWSRWRHWPSTRQANAHTNQ